MSLSSLSILTLSIRSLLVRRLQKALQLQQELLPGGQVAPLTASIGAVSIKQPLAISPSEISLNRFKQSSPIRYVSAIAFRLARQLQMEASRLGNALDTASIKRMQIEIAQIVVERLADLAAADLASESPNLSALVWQNCQVQTAEPGWVYLELTDRGVAIWLQALIDQQLHDGSFPVLEANRIGQFSNLASDLSNSTSIFSFLYTHARCCSLLYLANQTGLIQLDIAKCAVSRSNLAVLDPLLLPWQDDRSRLRCQHPAELQLVSQIVNVLDRLADLPDLDLPDLQTDHCPKQYSKLAHRLSQDFQSFYAAHPIWGTVRDDLPLAQVRLGLVLITQRLMQLLLRGMGIEAPAEL
ncbi:hypothetical protein IFO70_02750 [Phormidium tenue FACHB-886]|nr:hypothetical protein [Phormidium tenue FACHB-886]